MRDVKKEVLGVINAAIGLLLLISLVSYNPFDPSFSTFSSEMMKISNWSGKVGSYSSDLLIQWFGIGAFLIPLIFFSQAILSFRGLGTRKILLRSIGIFLALVSSVAILSIYSEYVRLFGVDFYLSGITGYIIGKNAVKAIFGSVGGSIVLFSFFVISLMMSTGISIGDLRSFLNRKKEKRKKVREKIKEDASLRSLARKGIVFSDSIDEAEEVKIVRGPEESGKEKSGVRTFAGPVHSEFSLPSRNLLDSPPATRLIPDEDDLKENVRVLIKELRQFGVDGEITSVMAGPMVTLYEFKPAPGEKLNRIVKLSEDLALALKAESLRIIKNIPGKGVMGIEVPNKKRERVYLKEILQSEEYLSSKPPLTISVGMDILGRPVVTDLSKMPHLLIAGTTGSGKSVSLNAMILSLLFRTTPDELRLILVDPKMLEFNPYDGIPNLLHPVVTQPKDAAKVLRWAVAEMEGRYRLMMENGVRNIDSYNNMVRKRRSARKDDDESSLLPFIVIVIDELSDLMLSSAREVEEAITRLSQMARASGIHLIVATQRPSVDVVTGVIKANFPCRISFKVSSRYDSYTILGQYSAEFLLGQGDMLFLRPGPEGLIRVHAPYVSEDEIKRVVHFLKKQGEAAYDESVVSEDMDEAGGGVEFLDERYEEAVRIVVETRKASISYLQRKLGVGFNRAARLIEKMEEEGIVTPVGPGGKQREVRIRE
ncbi:MAG: DNA translocase FtsK [Deltaproteobacteria bacterium]|nr:DNA translocase FtsK [Deltaproteobacteria bacterium]NIS77521.1 DNA translocase FtsK [Deltaproteobacteria bacterium]